MRVVVTGATGNVGTSVVQALAGDARVQEVVGLARRLPAWRSPKTTWAQADVTSSLLSAYFRGADVVIHLAWAIQPSRDERTLHAVNVDGSRRVFQAAAEAGVGALVHASSVGAYSPGPKQRRVDESWPTDGISTSFYSRHKAAVERILDEVQRDAPAMRVVRLRPGLIFKREAATGIRRLFLGPLIPTPLVRRGLIAFVPEMARLRLQAVHSLDVGEAFRAAALGKARGAFNVAAEPVLDSEELSRVLSARALPVAPGALRAAASLSWRLRLQPTPPGWLDLALGVPLMDTSRAREILEWRPRHSASEALVELLDGIRAGAGLSTPPLDPGTSGYLRARELWTGLGRRSI